MSTPSDNPGQNKSRGALVFAAVIIGLFFVGLMGLLAYGVKQSGRADREALPSPLIGKPAPAFELPLLTIRPPASTTPIWPVRPM